MLKTPTPKLVNVLTFAAQHHDIKQGLRKAPSLRLISRSEQQTKTTALAKNWESQAAYQ
ncbi:uncharacterized protein TRIVIDRAFT_212359 [Trichoderma virens Gv29-8]|uniref:Uncharacterized protein n=1 Tax=Hypocrea virens (strain Gv29-8 / FGSC 10586) TaxID=413071 RepID=G9MKV2_HYPVG|nr:uncharacterized protein TRIVIDRAFT_212359 [Trichoderma virens Gv29-8]EHK24848.1 hypothetical protein TRIVIDRAFT_212359 [Trichoderma virens Gv29-8]